jgi:hypothetical protein
MSNLWKWNKKRFSMSKYGTVSSKQTEHAAINVKGGTFSKPPEYLRLWCFTLEGMDEL